VRNGRFEAWSDNGNVRMMTTEGNRFNNGCKFQIHPANPQHIYLFSGSWFLVSTDGGQSFVDICNTRRYNKFIDINPTNENILTALQLDNIDVIYRSIDQGATFIQTPAQPQLQARQFINSLKFRPQTNELYIGTDNGLWVSTDDCETIELFAGPYYRRVLGIDFTTDGNALHIGTAEDGVWTYIFHDNSVSNGWHRSKQPKTCTLPTIFPNPFNQTTTVHFNIFENSHIRIDIFNLNGQCVGRLLDAPYNSGEYSIPWNAQSLASGTYIFRIHLDEGNYYIKSKLLR